MNRRRLPIYGACLLLLAAASQLTGAALVYGKAWLAPILMERAYDAPDTRGVAAKPWPWADMRPVARLGVVRLKLERLVLDSDSGNALAFGPGMAAGVRPGRQGLVMVAGHRDTHFRFLRDLRPADTLTLEYNGERFQYQVEDTVIADARIGRIDAPLPAQGLLLVTCYPFDAIVPGGPLRYVVIARSSFDEPADGTTPL